eukprot:15440013-Alexandrium_andersonii.AAC.1
MHAHTPARTRHARKRACTRTSAHACARTRILARARAPAHMFTHARACAHAHACTPASQQDTHGGGAGPVMNTNALTQPCVRMQYASARERSLHA